MPEDEYIVLVAAGHCGDGKLRPIFQWPSKHIELGSRKNPNTFFDSYVLAKGTEDSGAKRANRIAKNFPRVKHDKKGAVISTTKCTYAEAFLIKLINDCDSFLSNNDNSENDRMAVDDPVYVFEHVMEKYWNSKDQTVLDKIKSKEDFKDEDQVLQRFIAPRREKNHFVYDNHYDLRSVLGEYFTVFVKKYALQTLTLDDDIIYALNHNLVFSDDQAKKFEKFMQNKLRKVRMLILYSKLFGENNPLGIKFDGKTLEFVNTDSNKEQINVPIGKTQINDSHYEKKVKELVAKLKNLEPIYAKNQRLREM